MKPYQLVVPALVIGLVGVGLYAAPCLMGNCDDDGPSVADKQDTDQPCDVPCDPPCDDDKDKALAAAGEDAPCPYANGAEVEPTLADASDEQPCPHVVGRDGKHSEPNLADQAGVDGQAQLEDPAPDADGKPQT